MESDKKLLATAAMAIGHTLYPEWDCAIKGILLGAGKDGDPQVVWNPLDDDGDALRLLVAMPSLWSLSLRFGAPTIEMAVLWGMGDGVKVRKFASEGTDRAAVMRRAIVEAAARCCK